MRRYAREDAPVLADRDRRLRCDSGDAVGEARERRRQREHAARGIAQQTRREIDEQLVDQSAASSAPLSLAPASTCSSLISALGEQRAASRSRSTRPSASGQHDALDVRAATRVRGARRDTTSDVAACEHARVGGRLAVSIDDRP